MPNYVYESESDFDLYHYGVLGMKWGIRRYQNKDGTYTQAGVARYRKAEGARQNATNRKSKREATKEMKVAYKSLKRAKRADKGKKLVDKNHPAAQSSDKVTKKIIKKLLIGSIAIPSVAGVAAGSTIAAIATGGVGAVTEGAFLAAAGATTIASGSDFIAKLGSAKLVRQHNNVEIYREFERNNKQAGD